jgi:hypothetical protein
MSDEKKKKLYLLWIVASMVIIVILIRMSKQKVDFDSMTKNILQYTSQLENIVDVTAVGDDGIFDITLKGDSWYNGTDRDKRKFCKSVNETLTVICQKYKAIRDIEIAHVYYFDEDGIKIAEPGKGVTLESTILH